MHVPRAKTEGCQFRNNYDNLVITGLILLKPRMHVGTHLAMHMYVMCHSWGAAARAHVQSNGRFRSRERLDQSRSNLID